MQDDIVIVKLFFTFQFVEDNFEDEGLELESWTPEDWTPNPEFIGKLKETGFERIGQENQ